jgi:Nucleotidyl transferase AbiEii toxin, Type IV TA system
MTPEEEALAVVTGCLTQRRIPYMVTGSLASSHHGRPRMTHDIDLVIDPSPDSLRLFVEDLADLGFYVDADAALDAALRRRQFNAIQANTGIKVDLIVCKDRPFSREELGRRKPVQFNHGLRVDVASAEDTILSKLEWARKGGSDRQLADVAGMLAVVGPSLDRDYLERWALELEVDELWHRALAASVS